MRSSAVPPAERVTSLDVVRGVALYGVMAMNLVVDGFRVSFFERFLPETTPKPWLDRVVENFLLATFDLKAFALFSFLFGIGLAIQFDRLPPDRRTLLLVRRLAVLLTIGIIHLVFIWNGDILTEYAVVGFVALPFLFGSRLLLAIGSICLLAFYAAFPATMPFPDAMWFREHVSAATSIYPTGDYAAILKLRIEELQGFLPLHVGIFPRTLGLFLLGAFIWRTGLVSRASDNRDILVGIALLGVVATVGLRSNALADVTLALTYAAIIFAIMTTQAGSKLLGWAAPLGRMAFTNYLLQSLIFGFVFYGYGLGLFGKVGVTTTLCFGTAVYVGQVMLSRWWLRNHTFGPVEWLWRRLMYGSPHETAACDDIVCATRGGPRGMADYAQASWNFDKPPEGTMDMKRLAIGTIVGGITSYIAGYVIFDAATVGTYYAANVGMAGVLRDVPVQWAIAVSSLAQAAFITYCIATRANAQTVGGGLLTGLVIGFVIWFVADFSIYGSTNMWNLQLTITDPILSSFPAGVAGAAIAAVLARVPKAAAA